MAMLQAYACSMATFFLPNPQPAIGSRETRRHKDTSKVHPIPQPSPVRPQSTCITGRARFLLPDRQGESHAPHSTPAIIYRMRGKPEFPLRKSKSHCTGSPILPQGNQKSTDRNTRTHCQEIKNPLTTMRFFAPMLVGMKRLQ